MLLNPPSLLTPSRRPRGRSRPHTQDTTLSPPGEARLPGSQGSALSPLTSHNPWHPDHSLAARASALSRAERSSCPKPGSPMHPTREKLGPVYVLSAPCTVFSDGQQTAPDYDFSPLQSVRGSRGRHRTGLVGAAVAPARPATPHRVTWAMPDRFIRRIPS